MSPSQYGFKKRRSTADAIKEVIKRADEALESKTRLYTLFVDYEKAFNSVKRGKLIENEDKVRS